jgi:hypothetical protein
VRQTRDGEREGRGRWRARGVHTGKVAHEAPAGSLDIETAPPSLNGARASDLSRIVARPAVICRGLRSRALQMAEDFAAADYESLTLHHQISQRIGRFGITRAARLAFFPAF